MSVKVLVDSRGKQFKVSKQHIPGLANRMPPLTVSGLVVYCTCVLGTGGLFLGGHEPFQGMGHVLFKVGAPLESSEGKTSFSFSWQKGLPWFLRLLLAEREGQEKLRQKENKKKQNKRKKQNVKKKQERHPQFPTYVVEPYVSPVSPILPTIQIGDSWVMLGLVERFLVNLCCCSLYW